MHHTENYVSVELFYGPYDGRRFKTTSHDQPIGAVLFAKERPFLDLYLLGEDGRLVHRGTINAEFAETLIVAMNDLGFEVVAEGGGR